MAKVIEGKFQVVTGGKRKETTREGWLKAVADRLRPIYFKTGGVVVPTNIRFALSFTSTGRRVSAGHLGECWNNTVSKDAFYEIIVRVDQDDPLFVAKVIAHELIHASVPAGSGHGPIFKEAALACGLEGKMTQALPGAELTAKIEAILRIVGPLPHGALQFSGDDINAPAKPGEERSQRSEGGPKKQGTRLLKAECKECGYTVRVTKKWADVGAPHCPNHGAMELS